MDGNKEDEMGEIAALLGDSLFHNIWYADEDELYDKAERPELGNDQPNVILGELDARVKWAQKYDLSAKGANYGEDSATLVQGIFKIRLETRGPAKVAPLRIDLSLGSK